ncbi:hypothetical protein [Streptomyces sp. NRRL F-2799]|nr:hypothetical protein [Streptomyces sp. NRRL F-2799]
MNRGDGTAPLTVPDRVGPARPPYGPHPPKGLRPNRTVVPVFDVLAAV